MRFSVPDDLLDHRSSDPLDRRKSVTDITVIYRKITNPTIDIRRQDRNSHLPASVNVFSNLSRVIDHRSHQRCHILYRIIVFQVRSLVRDNRICRRMRLIERILCEIDHLIINLIRNLLIYSIFYTARNAFFFITIHKVLTFPLHHVALFLTHGTAHKVASSKRISGKITHDLHNLFLIYDTSVSRCQDWL